MLFFDLITAVVLPHVRTLKHFERRKRWEEEEKSVYEILNKKG